MEADFEVMAVLKGPENLAKFTMSYLRPPDPDEVAVNGPMLVCPVTPISHLGKVW